MLFGARGVSLVPERDPAALATAITRLLGSPQLAHDLGVRARLRIGRDYSWTRTAERMAAAYARAKK
ncbi:D-inositol-3-phosphate glycosyltransferase [compost metagenome]